MHKAAGVAVAPVRSPVPLRHLAIARAFFFAIDAAPRMPMPKDDSAMISGAVLGFGGP